MRVSALTLEYPQRTRCAAAHGTGRHWVRRPAIRAPDDGRAEWFAGGADRATRVLAGIRRRRPDRRAGGEVGPPDGAFSCRSSTSACLPACDLEARPRGRTLPSPSRSNLRAGSCRVQEWRACATRSRLGWRGLRKQEAEPQPRLSSRDTADQERNAAAKSAAASLLDLQECFVAQSVLPHALIQQ